MGILEFLELFEMTYEKFSKDKSKLMAKWRRWEPTLGMNGAGKTATVFAESFDVFFFQKHARTSWNISGAIDYRLLHSLYRIAIESNGRYIKPYIYLSQQLGAHQNTIARYINMLDSAGVARKQLIFESANRKRIKILPMFHEEFKGSLLKQLPLEIDWQNHQF